MESIKEKDIDSKKKLFIAQTLFSIIKDDDKYTSEHSMRVAVYMSRFADKLNLDEESKTKAEIAALLHDIGKVFITNDILNKPSKLTDIEFEIMKKHSEYSEEILSAIDGFKESAEISVLHHEKYDGSGYPFNLGKEEISIYGRMLNLCDSFDAMTVKRVYDDSKTEYDKDGNIKLGRKSVSEALEEIELYAGKQFDPELAKVFSEMVKERGNEYIFDVNKNEGLEENSFLQNLVDVTTESVSLDDMNQVVLKLKELEPEKLSDLEFEEAGEITNLEKS